MSGPLFAPYEPRRPTDRRTPAPKLEVRGTCPADLPEIARIICKRDGGTPADRKRALAAQIEAPDAWYVATALIDGTVAGYGRAHLFRPPPDAPANAAPEGWHLAGLIVDPRFRRRGAGRALTEHRLAWLARRTDVVYFANAENRTTIDLHAALGFAEVTRDFWFPGVAFSGAGVGILFRAELRSRHD